MKFYLIEQTCRYLAVAGRFRPAWLIAGALAVSSDSSAQTGLPSAEPGFSVRSWESGGGVPGKSAKAMARTPDGYLWLGTQLGLIRFDGVRFVTLTTGTTPALGDNRISSLLVDREGVLWIGTQGGTLSRRRAGGFLAVPLDSRLPGNPIESLVAGEEGDIWLVTAQWGLIRLAKGICDFSNSTGKLPAGAARSMVRLSNGEWWAMANVGMVTLSNGKWQAEQLGLEAGRASSALTPDRQGAGLWLATSEGSRQQRGARIFKIEGGKVVREIAPYPWPQDARFTLPTSIAEDARGRVWVATQLNGVYCWQPERGWQEVKSTAGNSYIQIKSFLAADEGLFWIATADGMLHRIAENLVATVPLPPDREKEIIVSVCITRDGTLWAGTDSAGVFQFREGHFQQVSDGLESLNVGTLFEDSRSNLWVGTLGGLSRRSGEKFAPVSVGTSPRSVYALCEDRHGNVWAGYGAGVGQLRPDGSVQLFGRESGLGNTLVLGLAEDTDGRICASQETSGLFRLIGERFERFAGPGPEFGADGCLLPDEEGAMWVANQSKGLHRIHGNEFRSWSFADGLPNDYLRSVIPDAAGNLWFSASKGIFGCSKKALLDYQRGKTPPVLFWRLGEADGMQGTWTSGFGQPVAARSADGRLWFPNRNVVAVVDPKMVTRPRFNPPVLIEEVRADGVVHPVQPDGTVELLSGARRLEINYTCADLRSPENRRFRYRLEGFDASWIDAGNVRVAHYGDLEPGDFRFRVMVGSDSGEWMERDAPLALSVLPRWWERTSVRILGLLTVTGLLAGTAWRFGAVRHRRRIEKLELQLARKRSEAELQMLQSELAHVSRVSTLGQLSTALAHELNQPLGAILSNAEAAEMLLDADPPELEQVREILADIRKDDERAGEVIRRMRTLLQKRAMQMVPLDAGELVQEVIRTVGGDAKLRKVAVRMERDSQPLPIRGDRVHLQQVILILIVNGMEAVAGNHTEERLVTVRAIQNRAGEIEVSVSDNGGGIPADQLARLFEPFFTTKPDGMGVGTSIARTIIQAHNGRIRAENNPDGGATFRFTLPIDVRPDSCQDSAMPGEEQSTQTAS